LFPNPVTDILTISNTKVGAGYEIYNTAGNLEMYGNLRNATESIKFSQLTQDFYLLGV